MRLRRGAGCWLISLALTGMVAACSGQPRAEHPTTSPTDIDLSQFTATPNSVEEPTPTPRPKVPTEASDFPDGTYRTEITSKLLDKLKVYDRGPGPIGIWTLTVKNGTYESSCRGIEDPATDCGNYGLPNLKVTRVVQTGSLHGRHPTLWFVGDNVRLSRKTGCVRNSEGPGGCGPYDVYHVDWHKVPGGMVFNRFASIMDPYADDSTWSARPWVRIS
jgi:hypothetical protein